MNITRHNYESWAIAYLEGTLSTTEGAMFMLFLAQNPDISAEIELLCSRSDSESHFLSAKNFAYLKKDFSSVSINEQTFEEFCIASHEGDLDADTQNKLEEFAGTNPKYLKILRVYEKLKINPPKVVYLKKQALFRRKTPILPFNRRRVVYFSLAMAASILLLAGWFLNYFPENLQDTTPGNKPELVESNSVVKIFSANDVKEDNESAEPKFASSHKAFGYSTKAYSSDKISEEVIDTIGNPDIFIPVNRIELSRVKIQSAIPEVVNIPSTKEPVSNPEQPNRPQLAWNLFQKKSAEFLDETAQLSVNQVLEKSVYSLNQLTEANLLFESETDEDGRIIAFALSTESFTIRRKVKSN